jgi:N-acetylglucosamine kinase-like BadF-type ATPase
MIAMLDTKCIGNRIKALRLERGMTQNSFAEVLGVSFQAVSNWERGVAPPDLDNLVHVAAFFGVPVDDLLRVGDDGFFLGIDGGGTWTKFSVVTSDGHVVKELKREGCNPNDIGLPHTLAILCDGIRDVLADHPSLRAVFCGISGVTAGLHRDRLYAELTKRYPKLLCAVKNDSANLFGMDDHAEMTVISGTGSVVFVQQDEQLMRLGGWGHLLDHAGSAYDMGREAIRTALTEEDLKKSPSVLTRLLYEKMGSETVWAHIGHIYNQGKPYIASFASTVFEAYGQGDLNAVHIVDDSAKALAYLLNQGVALYGVRTTAVASGGLFEHYGEIMAAHIRKYSEVELIISDLPPVYGACRNACKLAGQSMHPDFAVNFKNTYAGGSV